MYKSPIEVICGQMQTQLEGDVLKAVQKYGITVDKYELIKALAYDRNQYDKGYSDAMDTIVRCKDCICRKYDGAICRYNVGRSSKPDGYCTDGESRGVRDG